MGGRPVSARAERAAPPGVAGRSGGAGGARVLETPLPGVLVIEPRVSRDTRGHFLESWSEERYRAAGLGPRFVQDNVSVSRAGVIRGLHFQHPRGQGKLVSVAYGTVYDVAVDVRAGSPTFGCWAGWWLTGESARQLWIPPGYAHGFAVTSEVAVFTYKVTEYYDPGAEGCVRWDDPELGIDWPVDAPILSEKDAAAPRLAGIDRDRLPAWPGAVAGR